MIRNVFAARIEKLLPRQATTQSVPPNVELAASLGNPTCSQRFQPQFFAFQFFKVFLFQLHEIGRKIFAKQVGFPPSNLTQKCAGTKTGEHEGWTAQKLCCCRSHSIFLGTVRRDALSTVCHVILWLRPHIHLSPRPCNRISAHVVMTTDAVNHRCASRPGSPRDNPASPTPRRAEWMKTRRG